MIYYADLDYCKNFLERRQADLMLRYIVLYVDRFDYSRKGYVAVSFCYVVVSYIVEEQGVFTLVENLY